MTNSQQVSVSNAELADDGEALQVVGTVAALDGASQILQGAEDLEVAKVATKIGVAAVAAGASDLTRSVDAAVAAEKMQTLSDIVGAAGVVDVVQGLDMVMRGDDVRAMGAIVSLMSSDDLERGLEVARMAGAISAVGNVVELLDMPVLAEFLAGQGARLQARRLRPGDRQVMATTTETYVPRLKQRYNDELRGNLQEQLGLSSIMQAPTIEKIALNPASEMPWKVHCG
jgi:hypothetical protein